MTKTRKGIVVGVVHSVGGEAPLHLYTLIERQHATAVRRLIDSRLRRGDLLGVELTPRALAKALKGVGSGIFFETARYAHSKGITVVPIDSTYSHAVSKKLVTGFWKQLLLGLFSSKKRKRFLNRARKFYTISECTTNSFIRKMRAQPMKMVVVGATHAFSMEGRVPHEIRLLGGLKKMKPVYDAALKRLGVPFKEIRRKEAIK